MPDVLLAVSLVLTIVLPLSTFLTIESFALRYTLASIVVFSPVFCANLVFGTLFKDSPMSDTAFGWNLIGTMIGGAVEYSSLALGYQTLALFVAGLYLATALWAYLLNRRGFFKVAPAI